MLANILGIVITTIVFSMDLVFVLEDPGEDNKACVLQTFDSWHLLYGYYMSSDSRTKFAVYERRRKYLYRVHNLSSTRLSLTLIQTIR